MDKIKFGLWQAATLFKATGQNIYKILNMLGISVADWNYYTSNYSRFSLLDKKGMSSLKIFDTDSVNEKLNDFLGYFEEEYLSLRTDDDTLATFSRKVIETIFVNPYIGVFKLVDWQAKYIAGHSRISSYMYTHDNHYVYCCDEKLQDTKGNILEGIIADKFHILSKHFMSDGTNIYCEQKTKAKNELTSVFALLNKVDIASFRTIGQYYGVDNDAVYYYTNKRVRSLSTQDLKPVLELFYNLSKEARYEESKYAKDKEHVYHKGKIISRFPENFHQIEDSKYYTDGQQLFYEGKSIPDVDLASFSTYHPYMEIREFGVDKNNQYYYGKPQPKKD